MSKVKDCVFQYWDGSNMIEDTEPITLKYAKELWNKHYNDMVNKASEGEEIEVAIWLDTEFSEALIHLSSPEIKNGKLYEPKYYELF